jgi:hypothetical protein
VKKLEKLKLTLHKKTNTQIAEIVLRLTKTNCKNCEKVGYYYMAKLGFDKLPYSEQKK